MSSQLQDKLLNFETPPPAGLWEKIAASLEDEDETDYAKRLFRYEEAPAPAAWQRVVAALDAKKDGTVVPFFTRYKTPLRYIAAASVVAVLLVALRLSRPDATPPSLATAPRTEARQRAGQADPAPPQKSSTRTEVANVTRTQPAKSLMGFIRPSKSWQPASVRGRFIPQKASAATLVDFSVLENFMVFSDGQGTVMKLPKKLFHLVCCPDGDDSCRERLLELRQKLAARVVGPDFTGMLDQLRQLQ